MKKYSDRKQLNIVDDQLVQQNGLDNAQSEEDKHFFCEYEYEDEIPQHSENDVNHEVVNSNQHQDNGDMNHDFEDSTHQQPLSGDSGMDKKMNVLIEIYHLEDWMIIHQLRK